MLLVQRSRWAVYKDVVGVDDDGGDCGSGLSSSSGGSGGDGGRSGDCIVHEWFWLWWWWWC